MAEKAMSNRQALMRQIQIYEFALVELNLFLDSHPDNQNALAYLKKIKPMHDEAVKEYTQNYGPLMAASGNYDNYFTWIEEPWPWEYQANDMNCAEVNS